MLFLALVATCLTAVAAQSRGCTQVCRCLRDIERPRSELMDHIRRTERVVDRCADDIQEAREAGELFSCLEQRYHDRCPCAKELHAQYHSKRRKRQTLEPQWRRLASCLENDRDVSRSFPMQGSNKRSNLNGADSLRASKTIATYRVCRVGKRQTLEPQWRRLASCIENDRDISRVPNWAWDEMDRLEQSVERCVEEKPIEREDEDDWENCMRRSQLSLRELERIGRQWTKLEQRWDDFKK